MTKVKRSSVTSSRQMLFFWNERQDYQELVSEFANSVTPQPVVSMLESTSRTPKNLSPYVWLGTSSLGRRYHVRLSIARTDSGELIPLYTKSPSLFSDDQLYLYSRRCSFHNDQKKPNDKRVLFQGCCSSVDEMLNRRARSDGEFDSRSLTVPGDKISIAVSVDETELSKA